jgi:hypothetical protein
LREGREHCSLPPRKVATNLTETKKKRYLELKNLFETRMLEKNNLFKKNELITSSYIYAKKILDKFEKV